MAHETHNDSVISLRPEKERESQRENFERASLINLRPEASPRNKTFSHGGTSIHEHENLRGRKKRVNVLPAASLERERERII